MSVSMSQPVASNNHSINGSTKRSDEIPRLARSWCKLYGFVSKIDFPGTKLEISFALASAWFLVGVRIASEYILETVFDWPRRSVVTKEAAASMVGIFHSLNLLPALILCLSTQPFAPTERLAVAPVWWQQLVNCILQFCTGYMIYDGLINIILLRWQPGHIVPSFSASDLSFLFHHFATSFYMTSTRAIQAGHISAMMCMLLGEITNPFHNGYLIAEAASKLDCCNGDLSSQLHSIIEFCFSGSYCFFRILVGPIVCLYMTYDIAISKRGRTNIPPALRILWVVMIWAVILGSIPWIAECWGMLQKHLTNIGFPMLADYLLPKQVSRGEL